MNKKNRKLFILGCLLLVFLSNNAAQAQTDASALEVFQAAKLAHGGEKLDNLKTLRTKSSNNKGEETITLYDLTNQKILSEKRKNNKSEITLLEGNNAWRWTNGEKQELSKAATQALKIGFCVGVIGLRSECLKRISLGETIVDEEKDLKQFPITIEGIGFNYRIDQNSHLKEMLFLTGDAARLSIYDDFRTVNGIDFSFLLTVKRFNLTEPDIVTEEVITKISSIEVNPEFTASDWTVPN